MVSHPGIKPRLCPVNSQHLSNKAVFLACAAALLVCVSSVAAARNFGQIIPLTRASAATYYINGSIKGHGAIDLLVDTGSTYVVVDEPMLIGLEKNGHATYLRMLEGSMADGSTRLVKLYRIDAIDLGGRCIVHDVETAAFPAGAQPILGLSALLKVSPFIFSMDPPQLDLSQCDARQTLLEAAGPVKD